MSKQHAQLARNQAHPNSPVARGRPRDETVHIRIFNATIDLVTRHGYANVTISDIAARAGVGRQTIYRRWPGKASLALAAYAEVGSRDIKIPDTGSLVRDLTLFMERTFLSLHTAGEALRSLMAEAQASPGLRQELYEALIARRRADARSILAKGQARGDIDGNRNLDLLLDLLYGPMWYRLLVAHGPLDAAFARDLAVAVAAAGRPASPHSAQETSGPLI